MNYINPVEQGISRGFSDDHDGIDYLSPVGTPVKAAGDGTVQFVGNGDNNSWFLGQSGLCILLRHEDVHTGYAHLSRVFVGTGQRVKQGDIIGYSGNTGVSTGPHLHFEFLPLVPNFQNGHSGRVDPTNYLEKGDEDMASPEQIEDLKQHVVLVETLLSELLKTQGVEDSKIEDLKGHVLNAIKEKEK